MATEGQTGLPDIARQQEIRVFTKSTARGQAERKETLAEIRRNRTRQQELSGGIEREAKRVARYDTEVGDYTEQEAEASQYIEQVRDDIERRSKAILAKVWNTVHKDPSRFDREHKAIEEAQERSRVAREIRSQLQGSRGAAQREIEELRRLKGNYPNGWGRLQKFYERQGEELDYTKQRAEEMRELAEHIQKHSKIEDIAENFGVYIIHATHPSYEGNNLHLRSGATWQEKLSHLFVTPEEPAASSVKPGYTARTWENVGVILKRGIIRDASLEDQGTVVGEDRRRRSHFVGSRSTRDYQRNLSLALSGQQRDHNELLISGNIDFAGMFVNLDQARSSADYRTSSREWLGYDPYKSPWLKLRQANDGLLYADVFATASDFGMKVFAFEKGVAHEVVFDPQAQRIRRGDEVTPKQMLSVSYDISPQKRIKIEDQARRARRT